MQPTPAHTGTRGSRGRSPHALAGAVLRVAAIAGFAVAGWMALAAMNGADSAASAEPSGPGIVGRIVESADRTVRLTGRDTATGQDGATERDGATGRDAGTAPSGPSADRGLFRPGGLARGAVELGDGALDGVRAAGETVLGAARTSGEGRTVGAALDRTTGTARDVARQLQDPSGAVQGLIGPVAETSGPGTLLGDDLNGAARDLLAPPQYLVLDGALSSIVVDGGTAGMADRSTVEALTGPAGAFGPSATAADGPRTGSGTGTDDTACAECDKAAQAPAGSYPFPSPGQHMTGGAAASTGQAPGPVVGVLPASLPAFPATGAGSASPAATLEDLSSPLRPAVVPD